MNEMIRKDFAEIIQYATFAPSGHNSQPWLFKVDSDKIEILPDFRYGLSVVDPENRELLVSLGCALENLSIAAGHMGYHAEVVKQDEQGITVDMQQLPTKRYNLLFHQIRKRHTNRGMYDSKKIPDKILCQLQQVALEENVRFYFFEVGRPEAEMLAKFVAQGNQLLMKNSAFKKELVGWLRFNRRHEERTGNGLSHRVLGYPAMPLFLAKRVAGWFLKPGIQNRADLSKLDSSSHLVLFNSKNNTPSEWIDLGRSLQRMLLKMSELKIAAAFMNQPFEVKTLAKEVQIELPINNEYPVIMLRIGYAGQAAYSTRRMIEEVILK